MIRRLLVRKSSTSPFIANFDKGGWKVFHNGQFVQMLPSNTKVWSEDRKAWINVK